MYSTDKSTESGKAYMNPGITENVILQSVVFEPAKNDGTGQMVLRFYFEDAAGMKYLHTEFEVDTVKLTELAKQWGQPAETVIQGKFIDLGGRVRHILKSFLPEDQCEVNGTSWENFCSNVVKIAGQAYVGQKFRVKLVLNSKDLVQFPNKAITPFIQNMSVPNGLKINPKWDRIVPITPDPVAQQAKEAMADFGDEGVKPGAVDINLF